MVSYLHLVQPSFARRTSPSPFNDLPADEESVHEEREVEGRRFRVELVLGDPQGQRIGPARRDLKPPGQRTRAFGRIDRAVRIRPPRARRSDDSVCRRRFAVCHGGAPGDVRDKRIAVDVLHLDGIGTAVAVGIREKRIRPRAEFLKIRKSVSVRILDRIRQERHRPLLHLPGVGKSVTIRIPGMRIRIVPITIRIKLAAFSSDLLLPCWKYFNQP